jgi:hypothetical protein
MDEFWLIAMTEDQVEGQVRSGRAVGMMLRNRRYRPRDERGWIIPKPGTRTRQIYDLLIEGKTSSEIRAIIGGSVNSVGVLVHKIRQG